MNIEFTTQSAMMALNGGLLIGFAAALLLLLNGRIAGICGIASQLLSLKTPDKVWRIAFLAGLILSGFCFRFWMPESFILSPNMPLWRLGIGGLLVGIGTTRGNGCTSGHGVCGISRGSIRSLVATLTFMTTGILTVFILRLLGVMS
jgi:uncharacterized protein